MKTPIPVFCVLAAAIILGACRRGGDHGQRDTPPSSPLSNTLEHEASPFLAAAAGSDIHWQNWHPDVLKTAADTNRLIFALVGSTRYPGCLETLQALDRDPAFVFKLNSEFIPVLVDLDIAREAGLIAIALSTEARMEVSFPFLVLLSPDGSPVTWLPIRYETDRTIRTFFDNTIDVTSRLWSESPGYVADDSGEKLALRKKLLPEPDPPVAGDAGRQALYESAIRRILASHDEDLGSFAGSGGLFPFGIIDSLAMAAWDNSLPESLNQSSLRTLRSFEARILNSAMVDPLDGGIYPSRLSSSWALPLFQRECVTQARAVRTLAKVHQLSGSAAALDAALGAAGFAEASFLTPDGLFSLSGLPGPTPKEEWLWTTGQMESILSEDEYAVWKIHSGIDPLGNIPGEADPERRYFRLNSLSRGTPPGEIAALLGKSIDEVGSLIESGRGKLLSDRESRFPAPLQDGTPSASASFRMISAYAALFVSTGDPAWMNKAVQLGGRSRERFCSTLFINERADAPPEGMTDGRAFVYTLAIQASLDLGAITLDETWNLWAHDLATLLSENFVTADGRLTEVRAASRIIDLDYEDRSMAFDDSSAGLLRQGLSRLYALGFEIPPAVAPWRDSLPAIDRFPIVHTDTLTALSHSWSHQLVRSGPEATPALLDAIRRLPLDRFERRPSISAPAVTTLTTSDRRQLPVTEVSTLETAVKSR